MSDSGGVDVTREPRLPWNDDPDALYDHAPCGYLTTLPDGTIIKVNQTFLSWTGYARGDLVGRRFRDLLNPGGQMFHETHYAPLLQMQGQVRELAFDMVCADGSALHTLVNSLLDRNPAGEPTAIRTTVFDATDRRRYEKELLLARERAEISERRVRVLQRIVADLAAAATEVDVAEVVMRAAGPAFGAADSSVHLVDQDRDRIVPVASTDPATGDREDLPCSSPQAVARVAQRGDLHVIGSLTEAKENFPDLAESMCRSGRDTVVLLPLTTGTADERANTETLGVLTFSFAGEREFTDSELSMVRLLGQQAGQALDRARLYDDARRREQRATFLAETTRSLDELHRLVPRVRRLVERVVPEIADWAAVRLEIGPNGLIEEAGGPPPDPDVLADGRSKATTAGEPIFLASGDQPAGVVLPLTARGRLLGTLSLRLAPDHRVASAERRFLSDLADRAGLALENARLYEQERQIARTLQRSLLAGELPRGDFRFALESYYQASAQDFEVGGDWFDAFLISPDRLAVVIGDVVGRGIDAATTMGQLRSAVRALAGGAAGPAQLLEGLDRFVERVEGARTATVAYAEVEHPFPGAVRLPAPDGEEVAGVGGLAVGRRGRRRVLPGLQLRPRRHRPRAAVARGLTP